MLKDLIRKDESETLEFKESLGEWKEIIQVISAFANTKGGAILIGINEERKVFGVQIGKRTIEDLTNKIRGNTDPKIFPRILVENLDGEDIITIKVEESKSKPLFAFDRAYKRVGKSTVRATSDYFSTASVQVMVFADRIEVWNPGELPSQLTLEALRKVHPSIPRNPLIAELFYLAKYIEKVGSGTNEMIKQCKKEGLPEPEFQQKMGSFVAIVWRNIYTDEYLDMLDLNDRQKRAVKYVKEQGSISNSEYCGLFSVSRKTATNDLVDLVNKNIFDIVGTGKRNLRYVLKLRKNYAKTTQNKNNPWR